MADDALRRLERAARADPGDAALAARLQAARARAGRPAEDPAQAARERREILDALEAAARALAAPDVRARALAEVAAGLARQGLTARAAGLAREVLGLEAAATAGPPTPGLVGAAGRRLVARLVAAAALVRAGDAAAVDLAAAALAGLAALPGREPLDDHDWFACAQAVAAWPDEGARAGLELGLGAAFGALTALRRSRLVARHGELAGALRRLDLAEAVAAGVRAARGGPDAPDALDALQALRALEVATADDARAALEALGAAERLCPLLDAPRLAGALDLAGDPAAEAWLGRALAAGPRDARPWAVELARLRRDVRAGRPSWREDARALLRAARDLPPPPPLAVAFDAEGVPAYRLAVAVLGAAAQADGGDPGLVLRALEAGQAWREPYERAEVLGAAVAAAAGDPEALRAVAAEVAALAAARRGAWWLAFEAARALADAALDGDPALLDLAAPSLADAARVASAPDAHATAPLFAAQALTAGAAAAEVHGRHADAAAWRDAAVVALRAARGLDATDLARELALGAGRRAGAARRAGLLTVARALAGVGGGVFEVDLARVVADVVGLLDPPEAGPAPGSRAPS